MAKINNQSDEKVDLETFRNYRDEVLTGLDKVLEKMQFLHKKALQDE